MSYELYRKNITVLWSLTYEDLVGAGVLDDGDRKGWLSFQRSPHATAITFPKKRFARLVDLITRIAGDSSAEKSYSQASLNKIVAHTITLMGGDPDSAIGHEMTLLDYIAGDVQRHLREVESHGAAA